MLDLISDAMALLPAKELAAVSATAAASAAELRATGKDDDMARALALESLALSAETALLGRLQET